MRIERVSLVGLGLVALLSMSTVAVAEDKPSASATEWYSVALSDNEEAFVKTSSIKMVGTMLQARVKENYLSPRESTKKGKTYQSVRTDYRIDCTPRKVAMVESRLYSGTDLQGEEIQKASRNDRNLIWMDAPRATVFGEILDYTCKHAPTAAPGGK
jgi:hypothetical protein